ncbi:MAG: type II toxin-antitoxin system VapC family toxin [bacterium]|nr:type II toxin-antitoxin system VapC family toxin [bacterium]
MLDSDIIIWLLRGKEEYKTKLKELVEETNGMIFITPIQIAEIHAGLRENEIEKTITFLESLINISIDEEIGKLSGNYMSQYRASHNVTLADSIIAAATTLNDLKIWTLNKKHYPMFSDDNFIV